MNPSPNAKHCFQCGAEVDADAKFCSKCGTNLAGSSRRIPLSSGTIARIAALGCVLFAAVWLVTAGTDIGSKPTAQFQENTAAHMQKHPDAESLKFDNDPELAKLDAEARARPDDLDAQRRLATVLVMRMNTTQNPPPAMAFRLMDVLQGILTKEPNDEHALLSMAQLSFDQQVFSKAVEYYKRFLAIHPENDAARVHYATSLTFEGNHDEAIRELEAVLGRDPKNFQASAYLSITYAEKGDTPRAIEIGEKTLALAPSDEARQRFGAFLTSLKQPKDEAAARNAPAPAAAAASPAATAAPAAPPVESKEDPRLADISAAVRQSPIAGSKFSRASVSGDTTVVLYFRNFPMKMMPPFAKDKFFAPVREKAAAHGMREVRFVDEDSGEVLEALAVPEKGK